MTEILIVITWIVIAVAAVVVIKYVNKAVAEIKQRPITEDEVVSYMQGLSPEQIGALGDRVFDARRIS